MIHALIASVIQNENSSSNTDIADFPEIWNAYVGIKTGGTTPEDHSFMGRNYVNIIAAILQEFATGVPVTTSETPQQLYTDLAWSGIWTIGNNNFDDILSSADKARIYNRKNTEMDNSNAFGLSPSSNNSCLP